MTQEYTEQDITQYESFSSRLELFYTEMLATAKRLNLEVQTMKYTFPVITRFTFNIQNPNYNGINNKYSDEETAECNQ